MAAPETELRTALLARLQADAGVIASSLGAAPRFFDLEAPPDGDPRSSLPYVVVSTSAGRPYDTTTERGCEIDVEFKVRGEYEGAKAGEAILYAIRLCLRDFDADLPSHRLVNLVQTFSDVRSEEGSRYFGVQRWRAVTMETS